VQNSKLGGMFHPSYLLSAKEDAADNFARGHYTVGKEMMDKINDRIRKLVDNCQNVQGFIMTHSVGGGTGSGLGCLMLERLGIDYGKKPRIGFEVYPSEALSNSSVEAYNSLLATHCLLDNTDVSLLIDNEAVYDICFKKLRIKKPSYENLNRIISKVISSMTASLRFSGELNVDINEIQTNLVPFPRLHFMTTSMAPIVTSSKAETEKNDVQSITEMCLNPNSFLVKLSDFNVKEDKYMAIMLNYRGNVNSQEAAKCTQWSQINKKVYFVDWSPRGFKVGLNEVPPAIVPDDDLAPAQRNVVMIGNNTAIQRVFCDRICKKYDVMYSQRAFVHWYVGEGMEEGEFADARENLGFLEKDYMDVLTESDAIENGNDE